MLHRAPATRTVRRRRQLGELEPGLVAIGRLARPTSPRRTPAGRLSTIGLEPQRRHRRRRCRSSRRSPYRTPSDRATEPAAARLRAATARSPLRHPTQGPAARRPRGHRADVARVRRTATSTPPSRDLTIQHAGEPLGERIIVTGRVLDGDGRPVRHQLVEIWQANAAGRYIHKRDQHPAPLDPNFTGVGRCSPTTTAATGSPPSSPAPTRGRTTATRGGPAHIHFSLFGTAFTQRLITQMYFPGDPLFALDPIYQSIVDPARPRAPGRDLRPRRDRARVGARLPVGHRAHRVAPHLDRTGGCRAMHA